VRIEKFPGDLPQPPLLGAARERKGKGRKERERERERER
jgi:hypothetical protein